jgi:hypothetical protein
MRPVLLVLPALTLWLQQPAAPPAKEKAQDSAYYPLKVGAAWVYRAGDRTVTVRVVKYEPVGEVSCARLEADLEAGVKLVEHVAAGADGVYRYQANGKKIDPPLCVLKLPPKAGESWKVDSAVDSTRLQGTFSLGQADVAVPAGKYKAITVASTDYEIALQKAPFTNWYAAGVGLVKQRVQVQGREMVLELERYEVPKAK